MREEDFVCYFFVEKNEMLWGRGGVTPYNMMHIVFYFIYTLHNYIIYRSTSTIAIVLSAGITTENTPSIGLFKSLGFNEAGVFHNTGYKFGRFLDVTFLEYCIPETEGPGDGKIPAFIPFPWDNYVFGQSLLKK